MTDYRYDCAVLHQWLGVLGDDDSRLVPDRSVPGRDGTAVQAALATEPLRQEYLVAGELDMPIRDFIDIDCGDCSAVYQSVDRDQHLV